MALERHTRDSRMSAIDRYCCKSLFALGIKTRLRVKMWGTSSPHVKLTGNFGNVIEVTRRVLPVSGFHEKFVALRLSKR